MTTALWSIGLTLLSTIVGSFGPVLLKKASEKKLLSFSSLIRNYKLFGGLSLYVISSVIFITALRGGELSVLYPIIAVTYIWVSLLSMKFLSEKMNRYKIAGIALIIIGVSLIGIGR